MKPDADFVDGARNLLGRETDVYAERLEHVRAAGLARDRTPPCLATFAPAAAATKRRSGGDIERVRAVAAGAARVQQMCVICDSTLVANSRITCAAGCDLADGFLLHAQADRDRGDQRGETCPLMIWRMSESISS
jgi:hypothetical protein